MSKEFPNWVPNWFLTGALLVLLMVLVGGYTRLSHSGLSIVYWKPVTGIIPPLSDNDWKQEFFLYQKSPEYKLKNFNFTIEDFKKIFWPEYIHRLIGRIMALVFFIPFLYLLLKGHLKNKSLRSTVLIVILLGLLQGFAGWYMVKSGLTKMPAVSHYRLAIHFLLALLLFGYLYIAFLKLKNKHQHQIKQKVPNAALTYFTFSILIIQLIYGAFVAGLKAGLFYPTFPLMGNEFIPQTVIESIQENPSQAFVSSPYVVQFIHRWLGIILFLLSVILWLKFRKDKEQQIVSGWNILLLLILTQIILGIFTLIHLVPISLGVIHQFVAVLVFASFIRAIYLTRVHTKQI